MTDPRFWIIDNPMADEPSLPEPASARYGAGPHLVPIVDEEYGGVIAWANTTEQADRIVKALGGAVDTTLVLSFEPDAIRDHFDGDDGAVAVWVESATNAELEEVAAWCISADTLYSEFHRLLVAGVTEQMESGD